MTMSKEGQKQNRKYIWITLGLIVSIFVITFTINRINHFYSTQFQRAVQNHYRRHGASYVTLGELTNFEWDRAVYFRRVPHWYWALAYDAVGERFSGAVSERIGIVFSNGDEIVYFEFFPETWVGMNYRIHFDISTSTGGSLHIFNPNDVFRVTHPNFLVVPTPPPEPIEEPLRSVLLAEFGDVLTEITLIPSEHHPHRYNRLEVQFNYKLPLEEFQSAIMRLRTHTINVIEESGQTGFHVRVALRDEHGNIWSYTSDQTWINSLWYNGTFRFCTCQSLDNFRCYRSTDCFEKRSPMTMSRIQSTISDIYNERR